MDVFRNRLLDVLNSAKNEGADELAEVKHIVYRFFYELSAEGGFPDSVPPANISADLEQKVQDFLNYLRNNEDAIHDELENYTHVSQQVSASVVAGGKRRRRKTRKISRRKKHTRRHHRPRGKKL